MLAPGAATDVGGAELVDDTGAADGELEQPVIISAPPSRGATTKWRAMARTVTVLQTSTGRSSKSA